MCFAYFSIKYNIGASSSGKTTDFDSVIRWFKSSRPSQKKALLRKCFFSYIRLRRVILLCSYIMLRIVLFATQVL